jgi:prephenate dehydrogenase
MTVQITIIGTGQIGTSVGLALAEHKDKIFRVGHDKTISIANQAKQKGALDRVDINIPHAVEDAGIIVLALPLDQVRETMEVVGPSMKQDAVLIDMSPVKQAALGWARELLPAGRYYVGLTPVINPAYLNEFTSGVDAARADLFKNGLMAVVSPSGVPSDAIKLATDLTHLLGAEHLFVDPMELDSLMAAVHTLPQLLAGVLVESTVDQPGWREGRKLAGRPYAQATGLSAQFGSPQGLASELISNREQVIRLIDNITARLAEVRNELYEQDVDALSKRFSAARQGRERWLVQRLRADWSVDDTAPPVELPTAKEVFSRMVGFGRKPKPKSEKDN